MKWKMAVLFVLTAVLLSGCSGWKSGSFASVSPHAGQYSQEDPVELEQAVSYMDLRDAVQSMTHEAAETCVLSVDSYEGNLEEDVDSAIAFAKTEDPIGAYAIIQLSYRFDRIGSENVVILEGTYRHSRAEIAGIETARYGAALDRKLEDALDSFAPSVTLLVFGYQDTDFIQKVEKYARNNPDMVMERPKVGVHIYPEEGTNRVVELTFDYETSRDTMWTMRGAVETFFSSAEGYVGMAEDEYTKADRLYAFLAELLSENQEPSLTPTYSLLCQGSGDSAAAADVYAAMCWKAEVTCMRVDGTRDGEPWSWNIVRIGDSYAHVDLRADHREDGTVFLGDEDMEGYTWDAESTHRCERIWPAPEYDPEEGQGEPSEETEPDTEPPQDTEQPTENTETTEDPEEIENSEETT